MKFEILFADSSMSANFNETEENASVLLDQVGQPYMDSIHDSSSKIHEYEVRS